MNSLSPAIFIRNRLRRIFEAKNASTAIAQMPHIFDRDFSLVFNGKHHGWDWLVQHIHDVYDRLEDVAVEVTHAAWEGHTLLERHIVTAKMLKSGEPWQIEVFSVYELTRDLLIKGWHEAAFQVVGTSTVEW